MVKIVLVSIIFICVHKFSFGCKPLWDNHCKVNSDCCTGNCDRPGHWEFGVCKSANGGNGSRSDNGGGSGGCKPLWFNMCMSNSDCCSNSCVRGDSSWLYGVCKPRESSSGAEEEMKPPSNPMCGVAISNSARPAISYGQYTERGEFPWHAGIYQKFGSSWQQICGGTIISRKVVISAAHCFEFEDKENRKLYMQKPSLFKVGLGKYYRELNVHEDDMAQIIDVQNIQFSPQYQGTMGMYGDDIAFVTLKTEAEYTNAVRPVCIDIDSDSFENQQLQDGALGKIVGWGLTEQSKASETILVAKMPFVPMDKCKFQVNRVYLKRDKLCAGDFNSNVKVCPGDSGGGLVFEDSRTGKYYLRGVVSLGPDPCGSEGLSMFTKVSTHKDLVKRYLKL